MPAPKTPERFWRLKTPRLIHLQLAELVAQGVTDRTELAKAVNRAPDTISRIVNSPRFLALVQTARRNQDEARERANRPLTDTLNQEMSNSLNRLALIRDHAGRPTLQFKAASAILDLWGQAFLPTPPKRTRKPTVHTILEMPALPAS